MKAIAFFADTIRLVPTSATDQKHLSSEVSIRDFANGEPVSLYEEENGDLLVRTPDGRFMSGPEAVPAQ